MSITGSMQAPFPSTIGRRILRSAAGGSSAKAAISWTSSHTWLAQRRFRVTAHALPNNGKYREDNVSMTFTFPDGSIGVVDYLANGDKSFPKERVEVFCGGQIAVLDDYVSLLTIKDGRKKETKGAQNKGWVDEWKFFAKAIREGGQPPIPYEQLIGVTKATFAAMESLKRETKLKFKNYLYGLYPTTTPIDRSPPHPDAGGGDPCFE